MAAVATRPTKTDWAADDEEQGESFGLRDRLVRPWQCADAIAVQELPAPVETHDPATGITTIISYKKDEAGRTVKVSQISWHCYFVVRSGLAADLADYPTRQAKDADQARHPRSRREETLVQVSADTSVTLSRRRS